MNRSPFSLAAIAALVVLSAAIYFHSHPPAVPDTKPVSGPVKTPPVRPRQPDNNPCPSWPRRHVAGRSGQFVCPCGCGMDADSCNCCPVAQAARSPRLGGLVSPDGCVQAVPLPDSLGWPRNIASKGLGCCAFRVLDYACRLQNVPELLELPERMAKDGVAGGGWPEKVDFILKQYAGNVRYWNDTSASFALLEAAVKSKRLPCVDYSGHDPHYNGSIAHCVNVVACDLDAGWVGILDNNFPSTTEIVWMGVNEFRQRWHGWCYGLLAQTPGHITHETKVEGDSKGIDDTGAVTFGLVRPTPLRTESTIMDGRPVQLGDILAAIGPEMVPAGRPHIEVDHTLDFRGLSEQLAPLAAVVLAFYLVHTMKGRE